MTSDTLNVVLLSSEAAWQRALAHRIAGVPGVELRGIVLQRIAGTQSKAWALKAARKQPLQLASKVLQRVFFRGAMAAIDEESLKYFGRDGQPLAWPDVPMLQVDDINGSEAVNFVRDLKPDAIAVSGTKIIRAPIFELAPSRGLLNLHTGISPFYKGGPNCTLWCLARHEPQFIGATLHSLDAGIDTGAIFLTEQVHVEERDTHATLVCQAIALGHDQYARVLEAMARGQVLEGVPQGEIGSGRTFYTREWNVLQLARAVGFVRSGRLARWVRAGRPGARDVKLVNVLESGASK